MWTDRQTDMKLLVSCSCCFLNALQIQWRPPSIGILATRRSRLLAGRISPHAKVGHTHSSIHFPYQGLRLFFTAARAFWDVLWRTEWFIYIHLFFQQLFSLAPSEDSDIIHACSREWKGLILKETSQLGFLINEVEICWRLFRLASL